MSYTITSLSAPPTERGQLEAMLHDYMTLMLSKLEAIGGPKLSSKDVLKGLWEDF